MRHFYQLVYNGPLLYDYVYSDLRSTPFSCIAEKDPSNLRGMARRVVLSNRVTFPLKNHLARRITRVKAERLANAFNKLGGVCEGVAPCLVLFADLIPYERHGLTEMARRLVPGVRVVWFFNNIVAANVWTRWLVEQDRSQYDAIVSFDKGDAERYGLYHHALPLSRVDLLVVPQEPEYDVCFVGEAKDRLALLIDIYDTLSDKGISCFFYITKTSKGDRIVRNGIVYGDNVTYEQYLAMQSRGRCILEIVQGGGVDSTLRLQESILLNRKFLSNSPLLQQNSLYDASFMRQFNAPEEISVSFVMDTRLVHYGNNDQLSPLLLLEDLDKLLS